MKAMKRHCKPSITVLAVAAVALIGCGGNGTTTTGAAAGDTGGQTRMIGPDRRLAVRNECWYALDSSWQNNSNPTASDQAGPSGNAGRSTWHYISTDGNNNALRYVVGLYKGYTSDAIPGTDGVLRNGTVEDWVRYFASDSYAMNYGGVKGVGHGLQCPSFVSMILFRALGGYQSGNMNANNLRSDGSAKSAQPGDVVFYTNGGWGHVAICVRNINNVLTVVDSNFVGGDGNEVIARHDISYSDIGTKWKLYSGKGRWY